MGGTLKRREHLQNRGWEPAQAEESIPVEDSQDSCLMRGAIVQAEQGEGIHTLLEGGKSEQIRTEV